MQSQDYLEDYLLTITGGAFDSFIDGELDCDRGTPSNESKETFKRMIAFLEGFPAVNDSQDDSPPFEAEFLNWTGNITTQCKNRSFFTTKNGRIGLGPATMVKGDKICVFQGMPWPVVLRWNDEKSAYFFIGLAYVHGIMAGEVFTMKEDQNNGVEELESFIIC
jgi:hypothetical protein